MFFNSYPYTDFHELNLDWILKTVTNLYNTMTEFVNVQSIKYADPLQWSITSQYEQNTIVQDNMGNTYLSKKAVPVGISLTNSEYWLKVADFSGTAEQIMENIAADNDEASTTTSKDREAGTLVWLNNYLYEVVRDMQNGDRYVMSPEENPNVKLVTVEEYINEIDDKILDIVNEIIGNLSDLTTTDKSNVVAAINEVKSDVDNTDEKIGDLDSLTTTDKTDLVSAVNEVNGNIGDLGSLTTTDKTDLVSAVNEVDGDIGDLDSLTTTAKNNLVAAINEVADSVVNIPLYYTTPEVFGAKGDGVTDDTDAIKATIAGADGKPILFSQKTYIISDSLELPNNATLIGNKTIIKNTDDTILNIINASGKSNITIKGIDFDYNSSVMGPDGVTFVWLDGVLTFSDCTNVLLEGLKIHGMRYSQSGIIIQGSNNTVNLCEVYSGAGNRHNSGIVTGRAHLPSTQTGDGGSTFTTVSNCYVHDLSLGTSAHESGYGIYFLSSSHCECYGNYVSNINWVAINCQIEAQLPTCDDINIHDNITIVDDATIYPRQDYYGPFNIYCEGAYHITVANNTLVCGNCTSTRYIPMSFNGSGVSAIVTGNKFLQGSVNNVLSLLRVSGDITYADNYVNFTPPRYFMLYNNPTLYMNVSGCSLPATGNILNIELGEEADVTGTVVFDNCITSSTSGSIVSQTPGLSIAYIIKNCKISGRYGFLDYGTRDVVFLNNIVNFTDSTSGIIVRYGHGNRNYSGNTFTGAGITLHVQAGDATGYDEVIFRDNNLKTTNQALFMQNAGTISRIVFSDNLINSNLAGPAFRIGSGSTVSLAFVDNNDFIVAYAPVDIVGTVTKGFVCNNSVSGSASIGVSGSASLLVENNNCLA